ncbi:glycosyltransferase family 2 protein [Mesorhizobium escarrei]|uniref:Glycosyltransferase 2-like domain-containing protein n=1 Tax=Mesorhizobium escarrei TaxID=666018 RepID=A0ABN8KFZ3_9HYPH|nr:glycosyltransferase family A protein [Mesorhizobium escarrei]CAH2407674.1 hypothetical protein MES5069_620020 [Mesorhizobium escarrei]
MSQHNATVIGVVVPMFNAERTILPTLTSICQQSHQALDIIVAAYAEQDRRIRLFRQPNAGVAHARNSGAAATDAEFLAFVDADDLWAPSKSHCNCASCRKEARQLAWHIAGLRRSTRTVGYFHSNSPMPRMACCNSCAETTLSVTEVDACTSLRIRAGRTV